MCTHNVLFQLHFHQLIKHYYSFTMKCMNVVKLFKIKYTEKVWRDPASGTPELYLIG